MWLMRKIDDEGTVRYFISEKKCFTVGRMNSDINLSDSSISRAHCVINIAGKKDCPFPIHTLSGAWLVDKKSKYGTFILRNYEWVKIEPEEVQELCNGTVIRFGLMDNIWRFEYKPLIACTSKLSKEESQEVKLLLNLVDGKLISKWARQCTVVFVHDLTVTVKVLLALINGVPIVTIGYLRQLVENVKKNLAWPDYKVYKPQVAESTLIPHLVSLNAEDHRKELFRGKKFVLPTKEQLESLREIITAAGGEVELLDLNGNWEKLTEENVIVIQLPCNQLIHPDRCTDSFKNLSDKLKHESNLRVVPETEIFQAIAYSSIEKYCNPKSLAFEIRQSMHSQNSCGDIIEEATPSQTASEGREKEEVVRNIGNLRLSYSTRQMSSEDVTPGRKRKHSPEQESSKKLILHEDKTVESNPSETNDELHIVLSCTRDGKSDESTKEETTSKVAQITESLMKNSYKKQAFLPKLDKMVDDFWNDFENNETPNSRKRKASESVEKTDLDEPEIRKRKTEDSRLPRERESNDGSSTSVEVNRGKSFGDKRKSVKQPEFMDNTDGKWIRRKNANSCLTGGDTDCDESEWINKNCKHFKKKQTFKHEPSFNYTEESVEDIGKKLLMEGWHRSRSSRMRTPAVM